MQILAATGHRPNKLGGYSESAQSKLKHIAKTYLMMQPEILKQGITVISGMALGWDTAWALAALELDIPVIAAIPFVGQERLWPRESQLLFHEIRKKAVEVVIVSDGGYAVEKMQIRNEWMVDHCTTLVALWDGSRGGTYNCIQYARKFKRPIVNLWEHYDSI